MLLFLGSDAASFVTGQNVWTDGGYSAAVTAGDALPVVGRKAPNTASPPGSRPTIDDRAPMV